MRVKIGAFALLAAALLACDDGDGGLMVTFPPVTSDTGSFAALVDHLLRVDSITTQGTHLFAVCGGVDRDSAGVSLRRVVRRGDGTELVAELTRPGARVADTLRYVEPRRTAFTLLTCTITAQQDVFTTRDSVNLTGIIP